MTPTPSSKGEKKIWKKGNCCFCGTDTLVIKFKKGYGEGQKEHTHCEICYTTLAGNACQYPNQYDTQNIRIMVQIAHLIIDKSKSL